MKSGERGDRPGSGARGEGHKIAGVPMQVGCVGHGKGSREPCEDCGKQGAQQLWEFERGERDKPEAVQQDGKREGVCKNAEITCDGQAGNAKLVEQQGVHGDRKKRHKGARKGGHERVARGIKSSCIDALSRP